MARTFKEFMDDKIEGLAPCGCGRGCGLRLEPRVDGIRPTLGGKEVSQDCYDEVLGREIDKRPIVSPRRARL